MAVFKCKMCGGRLEVDEHSRIVECEYCGTRQTLPKLENEKTSGLFDRAGDLRRQNEFDKAEALYEQILEIDTSDAEVYWSLVLCKYGIEYVEEPDSGKRIPTVHRAQFTSIFADENFKSAIEYADDEQKKLYSEEAEKIEQIQKEIIEISSKEDPFDVFICYKESDENGDRTEDSVIAYDLYQNLTKNGYKVFFSRVTLESKLGTAYEPYIFSALNSSKIMIVIGTKPEYFDAVWVKNEWSRFLKMMKEDKSKTLIPAYKNMNPYALPKEFSYLQAQDMSKLGFLQDIIHGIDKILESNKETEQAENGSVKPTDKIKKFSKKNKIIISIIASVLVVAIIVGAVVIPKVKKDPSENSSTKISTDSSKNGSASDSGNDSANIAEPSDLDWDSLQNVMLFVSVDYDCENATAEDAMRALYDECTVFPMYGQVFDDEELFYIHDNNYKKDPKGIFTYDGTNGYRKYPVEKFNWILEHVMNVEPKTISELKIDGKVVAYEKDGYYYGVSTSKGNRPLDFSIGVQSKKQLPGGKIEITAFESYDVDELTRSYDYVASVAVKDVDEKHFWSIYKWSCKIEETQRETAPNNDDYYDYGNYYEEPVDYGYNDTQSDTGFSEIEIDSNKFTLAGR